MLELKLKLKLRVSSKWRNDSYLFVYSLHPLLLLVRVDSNKANKANKLRVRRAKLIRISGWLDVSVRLKFLVSRLVSSRLVVSWLRRIRQHSTMLFCASQNQIKNVVYFSVSFSHLKPTKTKTETQTNSAAK